MKTDITLDALNQAVWVRHVVDGLIHHQEPKGSLCGRLIGWIDIITADTWNRPDMDHLAAYEMMYYEQVEGSAVAAGLN